MVKKNISKLVFVNFTSLKAEISCCKVIGPSDSTRTVRLLAALNFYALIVVSGFALINYHRIEICRTRNLTIKYLISVCIKRTVQHA